jgi:plastocyanin
MYPPVPDLASDAVQQLSDGALFWILQHGVRWTGMPAFRDEHTADETWRLVSFIRHVPAGSEEADQTGHARHGALTHRQAQATAGANTVRMDGTAFMPAEIDVHAGDTITWINDDPFPHDVTAVDGRFHTTLQPDEQWQFRATAPGRFEYVCTLHPGMRGVFVVQQKSRPTRRN